MEKDRKFLSWERRQYEKTKSGGLLQQAQSGELLQRAESAKGCTITTDSGREIYFSPEAEANIYKTVAAFRKAVDGYFLAITRERKLTEWVDSGERTNKGKPVMVERDVLGVDGQPVMVLDYIVPPTFPALLLTIGVCKSTWNNYSHQDGFDDVCAVAKLRIEAWLEEQSAIKDNRAVLENLKLNYWGKTSVVEIGEKTREMLAQDMTMAEKMALIREAAMAAGDADDDD